MFARNIERLRALLAAAIAEPARPGRCSCSAWADGTRADLRGAVKVLLTGSAGFIGGAIGAALDADGHEVVAGRRDAAAGARRRPSRPPGRTGSTSATPRRGPTCSTASTSSATRPRWWAPASRSADLPSYAAHNDLGTAALLAAMHDARRRPAGAGQLDGGLRRGALRLPRARRPAAAAADAWPPATPATSRTTARSAAATLAWEPVARGRPAGPAQQLRRQQGRPGALRARPGPGRPAAAAVALRYHNVYGPGMPRDTPYSGVAAMFRSSLERGEAPQVFEDGGQMRDFVHVADVARANVLAARRRDRRRRRRVRRLQRLLRASPVSIGEVAEPGRRGTGADLAPEVTGGYRLGDVRHVVASPELAQRASSASAPRWRPTTGCPSSPPRRCGPDGAHQAHQVVYSRCSTSSAVTSWTARPSRRQRSGSSGDRQQQPRHERQPDPLDLGLAHPGQVGDTTDGRSGADEQEHRPVGIRRERPTRRPSPAPSTARR